MRKYEEMGLSEDAQRLITRLIYYLIKDGSAVAIDAAFCLCVAVFGETHNHRIHVDQASCPAHDEDSTAPGQWSGSLCRKGVS